MLAGFPDLLPGELIYSACARYAYRTLENRKWELRKALFGDGMQVFNISLPGGLEHLANQLPQTAYRNVDRLINEHTLFPYYAPFLSPERRTALLEAMQGQLRLAPQHVVYSSAGELQGTGLHLCWQCIEEDRAGYGEAYWHREHQIEGVRICLRHSLALVGSGVWAKDPSTNHNFVALEALLPKLQRTIPTYPSAEFALFEAIAGQSTWLLDNGDNLHIDRDKVREQYLTILADRGLATYTGHSYRQKLNHAFVRYFGIHALQVLSCSIDTGRKENWLNLLLRQKQTGGSCVLHHILMTNFLSHSLETILAHPRPFNHFGPGPWPCLNPVCDRYKADTIERLHFEYKRDKQLAPVGHFACRCGFTYRRRGPDKSHADRFRYDRIDVYGHVWEQELIRLWNTPGVGVISIAKRLGVSAVVIKVQAARLDLDFAVKNLRTGPRYGEKVTNTRRLDPTQEGGTQATYRSQWIATMGQHPDASVTELRALVRSVYVWLHRNDHEWLLSNRPAVRAKASGRHKAQNTMLRKWQERDRQLAPHVSAAVLRLRSAPGRPRKITLLAIERELGQPGVFHTGLCKMPITKAVCDAACETVEEFCRRKLLWAARSFGVSVKWKLLRDARIQSRQMDGSASLRSLVHAILEGEVEEH